MRLRALVALPVTLVLGVTLGAPAGVADPPRPPGAPASPVGQDHRSEQAEQALAEVQALLDGDAVSRHGRTPDGRSLTLALRDLVALRNALPAAQQDEAAAVLARPARDAASCASVVCVHYRTSGNDAPSLTDNDSDGVPDYVERVRDTTQQIHNDYVDAGYRRPKGDGARGGIGTDMVDIYLKDIGDNGLYGSCTADQNPVAGDRTLWAFCTLDDDYNRNQFPVNTPIENMRVTAAHEYFHAVQYAYDAFEDGWILESTATWVEDEMFDDVNDNRYFLRNSPLRRPQVPIDTFGAQGFHYGTWIWWRYLTEKFPARTGQLPKLVLDVWKRLDGAPGAPNRFSTQGLAQVLNGRGTTFKKELQLFYGVNRHPRTYYEEGDAYRPSPTRLNVGFSGAQRKAVLSQPRHMSSNTVKLNPNGLSHRDWKLRLTFNAPATARGGAFVVIVYKSGGGLSTSLIRLNADGGGSKTVPFSSGSISHVDVLFVNTSTRFNCREGRPYSCRGIPLDDGLRSEFTGRTFRS